MREERIVSALRKAFGLAMILTGIGGIVVQLAKGGAPDRSEQASAAIAQGADSPRIENAKLETRAAGASLEPTMREITASAEKAEWVGYHVEEVAGDRGVCCDNNWNDGNCGTCRLEKENSRTSGTTHSDGNVKLEGARKLIVLYRLEAKHVVKIRVASDDCTLDADASADQALESFVTPEQRDELRRQAAFWMGAARGKAGLTALQQMAKTDPSSDVRAHVAFALSVRHEAGALEEMIHMANDDTSSHVRGQALFWLAQKAGKKAVGTIAGAIDNDPD